MFQPKLSVITVIYNGVKDIERTMLSVLNQTYQPIEYILIDGLSNDGTLDIIKKYQEKLYWHIRRILVDHEDANDVLQNVFIRVWNGLENFREIGRAHV